MKSIPHVIALSFCILALASAQAAIEPAKLTRLKTAKGYRVEIFAADIPEARSLAVSPKGTVFVGTRGDHVYGWKNGKLFTIAKFLDSPNGVAFRDGSLYVAEISRILRFDKIEERLDAMAADPEKAKKALEYQVVYKKLPTDRHHGWKFIAFGPDGALYVPVGAPCDTCEKKDPRYAAILRFEKLDGRDPEVFASGVRNTVGFDWHPKTKQLWFTENGRDRLGEDIPNDELNVAPKKGLHFGYPYCHQGDIGDPEFGKKRPCSEFEKPQLFLGPHVAALGMRFLDENTAVVAEHGSWNREEPIGYRVRRIRFVNGKPQAPESLLEGFLDAKKDVSGRPVDVAVLPDRSILVSDDQAGGIYRLVPSP
jgi:glucose/arabinose dehydrogenase